jgi:hypothetical protein
MILREAFYMPPLRLLPSPPLLWDQSLFHRHYPKLEVGFSVDLGTHLGCNVLLAVAVQVAAWRGPAVVYS